MPIVRRKPFLTVYAAFAAYFAGLYFVHYPVPGFFLRMREVLTALFFVWFAASIGRLWLRLAAKFIPDEAAEEFGWCAAAGAGTFAFVLFALGLAGLFHKTAFLTATVLLAVPAGKQFLHWAARAGESVQKLRESVVWPTAALAGLTAALAAAALLCAFAPPTYYDSLVYHLALPAKYLQEGRIGFIAYNHYSHFPQNMEMLFGWFLAVGDDVSAHVFMILLAGLAAASMLRIAKLFFPDAPRWTLLLFATAPCTLLLSTETYVEVPMALWTTLAVEAALRARHADDGPRRRGWLMLCGLAGGFAAGIKYTGVLTPGIVGLLVLFWPSAQREGDDRGAPDAAGKRIRSRIMDAACVALPAFFLFLPWLVKNFIFTGGNPVFPFLSRWFPAENVYLHQNAADAYFQVLDEYKGKSSLLVELFQLPWRLMSNPLSFGGGYDVTGDLGWALPLILSPLFLLFRLHTPAGRFLFLYILAHGILWASLRPVLRFLYPVFPLACLTAGAGAAAFMPVLPGWGRWAVRILVTLFLLSNGVLFYLVESVRDPVAVAIGLESRHDYLQRKLTGYAAWEFINARLPEDARVLFVGEARGYYVRRPYVAPMPHLPQPLREWTDEAARAGAPAGENLRRKLLVLGFTHVFFHRREAERLKSYRVLDLTEAGRRAWDEMLAILPAPYDDGGAAVYALTHG